VKFSVLKHNKNGSYKYSYDCYLNVHWFSTLSNTIEFTTDHEEADFTILPIIWEPNYEYDTSINSKKFKNLIILDFLEFGCGTWIDKRYQQFYSFFGLKYEPYDGFFEREKQFLELHKNLYNSLKDKIRIYFKRELSSLLDLTSLGVKILPVDFINNYDEYTPCTEEQFWQRGLDLLYIWGRSSQDRVRLHGTLFSQMDRFGHNMFSSEKQYEEELIKNKRNYAIALFHKEWHERVDFRKYQNNSRTVIDLYGAGLKCFRTVESTIDAVSFKQNLSFLLHAYPWIHNENCIMLENCKDSNSLDEFKACDVIWHYIRGEGKRDLYRLYLKSCETNLKYRDATYLKNYFVPNIISELR
jgi:hypothetical protein